MAVQITDLNHTPPSRFRRAFLLIALSFALLLAAETTLPVFLSVDSLAWSMPKCCCCACVPTATLGIVERLGKFSHVAQPGLICFNMCTESVAGFPSLRIKMISVSIPTKSRDDVVLTIDLDIMYRVVPGKVVDAFYRFSDAEQSIGAFVTNVVRGVVPSHNLDEIFLLRDELQKAVKDELDHLLSQYGFVLVAALISDVKPADSVRDAMNQIKTNAQLKIAQMHRSEADKYVVIKEAEAEAEAKRLSGVGVSEQRKAAIMGLQVSVAEFRQKVPSMNPKDILSLLLMTQYFDCVKEIAEVGKGTHTVFMPNNSSNSTSVAEGVLAATGATRRNTK